MANLAQRQGMNEFFNTMLVFSILSNYYVPANRSLHEGLTHWLLQMHAQIQAPEALRKLISRALNNF
jgi:hypothetical protein